MHTTHPDYDQQRAVIHRYIVIFSHILRSYIEAVYRNQSDCPQNITAVRASLPELSFVIGISSLYKSKLPLPKLCRKPDCSKAPLWNDSQLMALPCRVPCASCDGTGPSDLGQELMGEGWIECSTNDKLLLYDTTFGLPVIISRTVKSMATDRLEMKH